MTIRRITMKTLTNKLASFELVLHSNGDITLANGEETTIKPDSVPEGYAFDEYGRVLNVPGFTVYKLLNKTPVKEVQVDVSNSNNMFEKMVTAYKLF